MQWIKTFEDEIGQDAIVDNFSQLNDGVILSQITDLITAGVSRQAEKKQYFNVDNGYNRKANNTNLS